MRKYILVVLLFSFHTSFSQSVDSAYYVKEFGWTTHLPEGFQVIDTATLNAESRSRESQIHWIKRPAATDTNWTKTIFWARDTHSHVISLNVIDSVHELFDPNFSENKLMSYGKSRISTEEYDGIKFYKLEWNMNAMPSYVNITLKVLRYGKIFKLNYFYNDAITENAIEAMLKTSKFNK